MDTMQLLGLDEGKEENIKDPVMMRGAYLSFLYLRHLRIRELQVKRTQGSQHPGNAKRSLYHVSTTPREWLIHNLTTIHQRRDNFLFLWKLCGSYIIWLCFSLSAYVWDFWTTFVLWRGPWPSALQASAWMGWSWPKQLRIPAGWTQLEGALVLLGDWALTSISTTHLLTTR